MSTVGIGMLTAVSVMLGSDIRKLSERDESMEKRVENLEVNVLVNRPFVRDVTPEELLALMNFTFAVTEIQKSGFLLSEVDLGPRSAAFIFRRGSETLTKIVNTK